MTTLTASSFLSWLSANAGESIIEQATPNTDTLHFVNLCISAADADINNRFTLPEVYTDEIELALLLISARLWARRTTPMGLASSEDFGAVRVSAFDSTAEALLAPFKRTNGWFA